MNSETNYDLAERYLKSKDHDWESAPSDLIGVSSTSIGISFFEATEQCPVCNLECKCMEMFSIGLTDGPMWKGCMRCVVKILTDYPKQVQRLSDLERKFEELSSRIRLY